MEYRRCDFIAGGMLDSEVVVNDVINGSDKTERKKS